MKNRESLIFMAVAFVIGILVGVIGSNLAGRSSAPPVAQSQAPSGMPTQTVNYQQNIKVLQDVVAKDPANRNAWVELGNNYFDSEQPMQAVEAYGKALEINDQDPNVLTDQGIMFRRLGWYDKAIENFEKAAKINPQHAQSYYNLGIVYRYDLQDFPKAQVAWEKFIDINPGGPGAQQVRQELEYLKSHPQMPNAPK